MVEVPAGTHTITCTRLNLLDGRQVFLRTKWFNTSFAVTALDFPRSWSCHVASQEIEQIASMLAISCEEFFSQTRLYLGDEISDAQYTFEALGRRPSVLRLSWTTTDMKYIEEPRVALFLREDSTTMELIPEFLNVLVDTTLMLKDLLAKRKIKSKKVRHVAMRFSASENVRKRSLRQQSPIGEGIRGGGGLNGLIVKAEFPISTPKFNSSTVSYEPASGLSTPTHTPSLTSLDDRAQQNELRSQAMEILPKQVEQSVSSTSKSLNLGVYSAAGRLVSEETMQCHGHQAPSAFSFDRPNGSGLGIYLGVSHGQLKSPPCGYHGISDNKREQAQDVQQQRMSVLEQVGEAVHVSMTDDQDYILDRVGSSQVTFPVKADVYDTLDRGTAPMHSPEFPARLYEHGLSSWAQSLTHVRRTNVVGIGPMSRPSCTFNDVAMPKNVCKTPVTDNAALSHESRKLGMVNSGGNGWINPQKSSAGVESRQFDLAGSTRRNASQGRECVIMLSDSEEEEEEEQEQDEEEGGGKELQRNEENGEQEDKEEDYLNTEVDPGVLDDEDLLDRRIPSSMEGLLDEPGSRFPIRAKESMPFPMRGNIELLNMNVSKVKDERSQSRRDLEPQASLGWRSRHRKRKERDDAHDYKTDIFDGRQRTQAIQTGFVLKGQDLLSGGSLSRIKSLLDAQAFMPTGAAPCIKAENEHQVEQNAVWHSGDHFDGKRLSTFNYGSRAQWNPAYYTADNRDGKFASTFNYEKRTQWNTWISEAKAEVTSWEVQVQVGNSTTGGSGRVGDQPSQNVVTTSSPCDLKPVVPTLVLKKLDRKADTPLSDSEPRLSPRETQDDAILPPSEESGGCRRLEDVDRHCAGNLERSCFRGLNKSKRGVSSDVAELEKVKVEREFIEVGNDGDSDSVDEHVFEPGLHNGNEGMICGGSVAEVLKSRPRETSTSIRSLEKDAYSGKLPGRRGRPPSSKVQLHPNATKSVSSGANTCTDGTIQSDKGPRKTNFRRLSRPARHVGMPKHSKSQDVDEELQKRVPDSDYYCFDADRGKEKIQTNQIWALYDGSDFMPRTLIRVKDVSVHGAFWVEASWLQPHTASKRNEKQKKTVYPRSCGDFEEPKETTILRVLNCFSHRMEITPKLDTVIQVYPRKGEVWALHKKEDLKQGRSEKEKLGKGVNEENGNFRLVVILSNCGEGRPTDILVLRKRTGYRTLWEPGYEKGSLPSGNLERFSHRVPAYKLTEKDYPDLNKSEIWDIDAAAVPECQSRVT